MKNSNDTIGNGTRDLPACSAVPQPTAPPRAPLFIIYCSLFQKGKLGLLSRDFRFFSPLTVHYKCTLKQCVSPDVSGSPPLCEARIASYESHRHRSEFVSQVEHCVR